MHNIIRKGRDINERAKDGFKQFRHKKMANAITEKAKERNLIKPLSEAFKDVPAKKEKHKGKTNYFK